MSKSKILILSDWYLPAVKAGGPVRSVSAVANALKSFFEISILTSDRDFGDSQPYGDIESDVWMEKDGYRLKYVSRSFLKRTVQNEVNESYDKIYLNSLFSKDFTIAVLRAIQKVNKHKVVIAPRGMLAEGALGLKAFKKKTFLRVAKIVGLYDDVLWHASTDLEKREILNVFPNAKVVALENLAACQPNDYNPLLKLQGELKVVFVSRISPKKNLHFLLELIQELNHPGIYLDIYGPKEDINYWNQCEAIIDQNDRIHYMGMLLPDELTSVLKNYHVFALPTLNENFGHIILEALNSSLPLLISNNTPWLKLEELGIGVDLDLNNKAAWRKRLMDLLEMEDLTYGNMRSNAWKYGQVRLQQSELLKNYVELFS